MQLSEMFAVQTQSNAVVAVVSGVVAQGCVELGGYAAPFGAAVPFLMLSAYQVHGWPENAGTRTRGFAAALNDVALAMDSLAMRVGLMQCLFEGSMHIFVFLWTPCLQRDGQNVPHGIVFSLFMLCVMIGGRHASPSNSLRPSLALVFAFGAGCLAIPYAYQNSWLNLAAFCGFEWCCGNYFTQIASLRSRHLREESRGAMMTLIRAPLNFIVIGGMLFGRSLQPEKMLLMASGALVLGAVTHCTLTRASDARGTEAPAGLAAGKVSKVD